MSSAGSRRVLVVNAGSSSVKLRLLDARQQVIGRADLAADSSGFDDAELAAVLTGWPAPDAVGHRIVHGGTDYAGPVRITAAVSDRLAALVELAPLHQPKSLAALAAVSRLLPATPAVACFDTAFHADLPPAASTYAIPAEWRERYQIRRFGFHGLSHGYAWRRAAALVGGDSRQLRVVSCHLGAGASLCAVVGGRSVDTTMGFTPLEGLVMATRSGSVDPGLILWLAEHEQLSSHEIADSLENRSGMLALAGDSDQRVVEQRSAAGDATAQLALEVYQHRLRAGIAAMAAAANGLDVLVFTGGVGENSELIRAGAAAGLGWLGVGIDPQLNAAGSGTKPLPADRELSAATARVRSFVVAAREDLQIARETNEVLDRTG